MHSVNFATGTHLANSTIIEEIVSTPMHYTRRAIRTVKAKLSPMDRMNPTLCMMTIATIGWQK